MKRDYVVFSGIFIVLGIVMLYFNTLFNAYVETAYPGNANIAFEYQLYIFPIACFLIGLGLIFLPMYFKK